MLPSSATLFETIGFDNSSVLGGNGSPNDSLLSNGKVYGDGSCYNPTVTHLARAGFAVVNVNAEGDILRAIYGCVPRSLPQTSLSAEYAAFMCAVENCRGATYFGDCQDVLSCFGKGLGPAMRSPSSPHADVWRIMRHRYGDTLTERVSAVAKVKAHQDLDTVTNSGGDVQSYWGNFHADELAKRGADLHAVDGDDVSAYKVAKTDVTKLARHIIETMAALRQERVSNPAKAPRLPAIPLACSSQKMSHEFRWQGRMWICQTCLFRTHSPSLVPKSRLVCTGVSPLNVILDDSKGHSLWTAPLVGGGTIAYCSKCWSYATSYPRKLGEPCKGAPIRTRHSKHFLSKRRHPRSRVSFLIPCRLHD